MLGKFNKFTVILLIVMAFSLSAKVFADPATAFGCVKLLESEDPLRHKQLYDRRYYYQHSMRFGYTLLKELAMSHVARYYTTMFASAKLLNPGLTKQGFCIDELGSLDALVLATSRLRDVYAGNSAKDCHGILKDVCDKADFEFDTGLTTLNLEGKPQTTVLDHAVKELLTTENQYVNSLKITQPSSDLIYRIISTLKISDALPAHLEYLFGRIVPIVKESNELLNYLMSAYASNDIRDELKAISSLQKYFENTLKLYKEYRQEYFRYLETLSAYSGDSNAFLKKIGNILIAPVQRVPRYVMLLEAISKALPQEDLDEVQIELSKLIGQTLQKAQEFAKAVDAD